MYFDEQQYSLTEHGLVVPMTFQIVREECAQFTFTHRHIYYKATKLVGNYVIEHIQFTSAPPFTESSQNLNTSLGI